MFILVGFLCLCLLILFYSHLKPADLIENKIRPREAWTTHLREQLHLKGDTRTHTKKDIK